MRKNMTAYLQDVLKRHEKMRRASALFVALSVIVSSGVIWSLHGVGITYVNEDDAEAGGHIHTEECYEKTLVCDLGEDDEHTHQEECYVNELICSYKKETVSPQMQPADEEGDPSEVVIDVNEADDDPIPTVIPFEDEEEITDDGVSQIMRAPGAGDGPGDPQLITTVDNIAEGIKFNLFDYGDDVLEGGANNYGETDHSKVKKTGINTGRDPLLDIMFFAYGTAPPHGAQIGTADGNPIYAPGVHDMNYYAGDYRANSYQSGNRPFQGIVKDKLVDGYPVLSASNHSLDYLFAPTTMDGEVDQSSYKTVYENVNHLLRKVDNPSGTGHHLVYNSNENYAYFNSATNSFEVYDRTFDIINDAHHKKNDVNDLKRDKNNKDLALVYGDDVDPGFKIGFFPFDEYNEELRDPNFNGDGYNHHFGMTMDATFVNLPYDNINVKDPITFKYSGDDDMWVFVDDKLILDIGGIHEPTGGMIDFSNGLVWVQDNAEGKSLGEVEADLEEQGFDWDTLPMPIGIDTASTTQTDGDKWKVLTISEKDSRWNEEDFKNGRHTIKMFYMERGGCYSNLAMEMNLPTVKSLAVTKEVDYKSHSADYFDNAEYEFQIYEKVKNASTGEYEWIIPADIESRFKLKANGRKQFDNIGRDRIFKVVEIGVNPSIYDSVSVNGASPVVLDPNGSLTDISSTENSVANVSAYGFRNSIREDTVDVAAKKTWMPALSSGDALNDFRVKFKLYRTDSITGEKIPVALRVTEGETEKLKRTFVLDKNNNWSWSAPALPSRYGNHIYTYSVEELNVPKNYKATYDVAADGTLQIINTNQNNAKVHVKKEWTNGGEQPVELTLKRKRIGYSGSEPTSLKIEIYDTKSNKITEASINNVYVGGSVEFALNVPKGVVYRTVKSKTPDTLEINYDSGFFEISNLAGSPNTIQLEVDNDNAEDSILLVHSPFTFSTDGWSTQGVAKIWTSGNQPYAKGNALGVQNVQEGTALPAKSGPILKLDPAKFKPGKTYSFSAYIRNTGSSRPVYQMVFNDGLGNERVIGTLDNPDGWKQLQGNIQLPENLDPYNMYIRIGTSEDNTVKKYYIDEFTAVEGDIPVSVARTSGVITVGSTSNPVTKEFYSVKFTDELYDGWYTTGGTKISGTPDYMLIHDRGYSWASVEKRFNQILKPGTRYRFILEAQRDGENGTKIVSIVINYKDKNGEQVYDSPVVIRFANIDPNDPELSAEVAGDHTIPEDADISSLRIYFGADDTLDYRLKSLKILDYTPNLDGYTRIGEGVYQSDNSQYRIDFDTDTITNPLKLAESYTVDGSFSRTITLDSDNDWKHNWDNSTLNEDNDNYLYQYYIAETKIGGITVNEPDSMGRILSADGNYLVSYDNDFVAANTENSPITVTNKYIWYKLPATGGIGTDGVCVAGVILAISGFIGRVALRKRERRYK